MKSSFWDIVYFELVLSPDPRKMKACKPGEAGVYATIRYADDALFFFKKEEDAIKFKSEFEVRCEKYGLKLLSEKTQLINISKLETHNSIKL